MSARSPATLSGSISLSYDLALVAPVEELFYRARKAMRVLCYKLSSEGGAGCSPPEETATRNFATLLYHGIRRAGMDVSTVVSLREPRHLNLKLSPVWARAWR
jgi:hypothetical protein